MRALSNSPFSGMCTDRVCNIKKFDSIIGSPNMCVSLPYSEHLVAFSMTSARRFRTSSHIRKGRSLAGPRGPAWSCASYGSGFAGRLFLVVISRKSGPTYCTSFFFAVHAHMPIVAKVLYPIFLVECGVDSKVCQPPYINTTCLSLVPLLQGRRSMDKHSCGTTIQIHKSVFALAF